MTRPTNTAIDPNQVSPRIAESSKILELITTNSIDLIIIYNRDFSIQYISPSVESVLGFQPFEVIGKKPSEIFKVSKALKPDRPQVMAYKHKFKSKKVLLESVIHPVYVDNEIDSYLGISRDVESREHLRAKLQAALEKEKSINQFKSKFISMASHELKNPLATIASSVDLMSIYLEEEKPGTQKKFEKQIERVTSQLKRLDGIINEILLIEKTKAQTSVQKIEKLDIVDFVRTTLEKSFVEYLPEIITLNSSAASITIMSSKALLYHILKNLIENAIKYSKPGEIRVEINIENSESHVEISIKDQGLGISAEDSKKLFTQFYRSDQVKKISGFGLGLTIVKECAAILNADLSFTTEINQGSTFTLRLPG